MEQLHALFVDHHSHVLVQSVTSVSFIATALREDKIISLEIYSQILLESRAVDKTTVLLHALNTVKAKSAFYNVLSTINPELFEKLERQDAQFVWYHSDVLIQRVSTVLPIADVLNSVGIIFHETYSKIWKSKTNQDKMRVLLEALNTDKAKSAFYNLLKDKEKLLVEDLKQRGVQSGSLAQTSSEGLEISLKQPQQPQNGEIVQVQTFKQNTEVKKIRWNRSSKRHGTKLEELLKANFEKVGNLCFCKDEKYMIGDGGSGIVYLGLKEDGTEVAIKRINKNPRNSKDFENELKHLRDLKLESKNIVKYVDLAEDEDFYYLALQLCECDLVDYMKDIRQQERKVKDETLRRIVKETLLGLQVLHHAGVIHRDIKPGNVLIDVNERARLADFGISRKLEEGKTTVYTDRAGTQGWEATEIVDQTDKGRYKMSSDIQVAGMLTYYVLSEGKHPFGNENVILRAMNILKGEYSLDDVKDKKATDLIEWMINKDQNKRPNIDQVLNHPYFWDDKRMREVLHNLGNKEEVQEYKNYRSNEELYDTVQKYTKEKSFSGWKSNAPNTWTNVGKSLPDDLLGLLRYLRNALGHQEQLFYAEKMIDQFPDFLISLHWLATDMGWEY